MKKYIPFDKLSKKERRRQARHLGAPLPRHAQGEKPQSL